MQPMANIAIRAARAAGSVIIRSLNQIDNLNIVEKSHNDFVTEVDQQAEQEIIKAISRAYPDHAILAEESGAAGDNEFQWIIDPLDGTTNFLHGFHHYAVSIAVKHKGRLEHAVIYDPMRDELFTASRGEGARLNDRRIRVTQRKRLQGALLGTGIPFRDDQDLEAYLKTLRVLITDTAGIRRAGSAALDLAYVAAGRLDGFWEFGLNPWDMAAGCLLIQEAGGLVTDIDGSDNHLETGNVLAANLNLQQQMQARLSTLK